MSTSRSFPGECLCERVRFEVAAPTRWCLHCHCTLCRKAHGAPFVTWLGVAKSQLRVIEGEDAIRWRDSSDHGRRAFCSACGSQLFFESTKWPDQIDVVRALIDGPIDREPSAHIYVSTRVHWVSIDDGLDQYPQEYQPKRSKPA